jgi:hypothetical protein
MCPQIPWSLLVGSARLGEVKSVQMAMFGWFAIVRWLLIEKLIEILV